LLDVHSIAADRKAPKDRYDAIFGSSNKLGSITKSNAEFMIKQTIFIVLDIYVGASKQTIHLHLFVPLAASLPSQMK
jgi:hypothetical protein